MKTIYKLFLFASFTLTMVASATAQDSSSVKFEFAPSLNLDRFTILLNDGINDHKIKCSESVVWRGKLYAPYGYISISYPGKSDMDNLWKQLFFEKGNTKVSIKAVQDPAIYYEVDEHASENIIPYREMGGDILDSFESNALSRLKTFYAENKDKFGTNPSLLEKAFELGDSVGIRRIEFIQKYPDLYVSAWLFQSQIFRTEFVSLDSLLRIFNVLLPDSYKSSEAGTFVARAIQNKIGVNSNYQFPPFSVVDIYNNKINSSDLRGKYLLVQIWASWCVPCVREIPTLTEINNKYHNKDFNLISFSIDTDSVAFHQAVERYSMSWIQIYGNNDLYNELATAPIPQVYLVDKTGRTIYNMSKEKDFDLSRLEKILSELLD